MQLAEFPLNIDEQPGIMLPVTINGKTYRFMLDTGATTTSFDESLRHLLGEPVGKKMSEAAAGPNVETDFYAPVDAMVGPLSLKGCGLISVGDFESVRKVFGGVPCDGVLGMSFISRYLWVISWDDQKICVCESLAPAEKQEARSKIKIGPRVFSRIPIELPGSKVNALLDTGYGSVLGLGKDTFKALNDQGEIPKTVFVDMATAGGMRKVEFGLLNEFKFLRGDSADLFEKAMVSESTRTRLGLPFLKAYMVIWDVPDDRITLIPRAPLRQLRKAQGLPDIAPPVGVPDPRTIPHKVAVPSDNQE